MSEYEIALTKPFDLPAGNETGFLRAVEQAKTHYEKNQLVQKLIKNQFEVKDYHNLLLTLFHQTYYGPSTFALAAANCTTPQFKLRDYLLKHAEEEKSHWAWVINDLTETGYKGPDPRSLLPTVATQAYVSYAHFLAMKFPLGRMAMALVLEGISGAFGTQYGRMVMKSLGLSAKQAIFFVQHGELDQGHSQELIQVIHGESVSPYDWAIMTQTATVTAELYAGMYDEAACR